MTLIETRKSRDIQSNNDNEEKIPYMQTFRFIKETRYHEGTNEKSANMVFFPHNHYQIVCLYFFAEFETFTNLKIIIELILISNKKNQNIEYFILYKKTSMMKKYFNQKVSQRNLKIKS